MPFAYTQEYKDTDFRKHPEKYLIGRGEQGVLIIEPYKSQILPHWRFKTPEIAEKSSRKIYSLFLAYKKQRDFIGMDMARKFLQMGYTRSRRYANHASGQKYVGPQPVPKTSTIDPNPKVRTQEKDWATNEKAQSARIFYGVYLKAREDVVYKKMKAEWMLAEKSRHK